MQSVDSVAQDVVLHSALVSGAEREDLTLTLQAFVSEFGDGLMEAVSHQNPPIHDQHKDSAARDRVMMSLKRKPFDAQKSVVQAVCTLLADAGAPAAVINAEMGTGKTMMAISAAAVLQQSDGYGRVLVISPPHLVYKWRREILETVPGAKVTVLNGPDTLRKLLKLRDGTSDRQEFFVLGRVRMRMGFHWRSATVVRHLRVETKGEDGTVVESDIRKVVACPQCGAPVMDADGKTFSPDAFDTEKRLKCEPCGSPLWSLFRAHGPVKGRRELLLDALCGLPTIGKVTAERLVGQFGEEQLSGMMEDNMYEFVNLMDGDGELVFHDKQARRIERALATTELAFGQGGYQPTEFIKRYLPDGFFDLLVVDEGHEFKNDSSAQGQAMGVLATKTRKVLLLTGTLMGGYADDLFFLLWRMMPKTMIDDGYCHQRGSLGAAAMHFMRKHGVLKDVFKESEGKSHRTSKGKTMTVRTSKAPGFGPKGIAQYVLPFTAFLKLRDIGAGVLPAYREHFVEVALAAAQTEWYSVLQVTLTAELKRALVTGDQSLLGVVLNVLLAWPDCCFREEVVRHPRSRHAMVSAPVLFEPLEAMPKELELVRIAKAEKRKGRKVLAYSIYTGTRDTTARLKAILEAEGLKTAVLKATVDTAQREAWIADQVDKGIDVLVTNPELVKTGLDLLDFPTIVFLQTGYNVYTLQQASRRSWRIGQKQEVDVYFLGYAGTTQVSCLQLMAKKIAVSQSTSGDLPDTGLDVLNQDADSIEVALAKQLLG